MTAIQPDSNFRGAFAHKTLLNWTEGLLAVLLGFASLFLLYETWQFSTAETAVLAGDGWSDDAIAGAARLGVIGVLMPVLVGIYAFTAAARQGLGIWFTGALVGLVGIGYAVTLVMGEPTLADMLALNLTTDPQQLTTAQILGLGGVLFMLVGLAVLTVTASFGGFLPIVAVGLAIIALPLATYVTIEYGSDLPVDLGSDMETLLILYGGLLAIAFVFACLDWCLRQVFIPFLLVLVLTVPVLVLFGFSFHSVSLLAATDPALAGGNFDLILQQAELGGPTNRIIAVAFATPEITAATLGFVGLFGVVGFVVALMAARRGMVPLLVGLFFALVAGCGFLMAAITVTVLPALRAAITEAYAELGSTPSFELLRFFDGNVPAFGLGALAVALLGALALNRLASR